MSLGAKAASLQWSTGLPISDTLFYQSPLDPLLSTRDGFPGVLHTRQVCSYLRVVSLALQRTFFPIYPPNYSLTFFRALLQDLRRTPALPILVKL